MIVKTVKNLVFLLLFFNTQFSSSVFGNPLAAGNVKRSLYIELGTIVKTGFKGHSAVIPCLPTSPQYDVFLSVFNSTSKTYERVHLDSRINFDPYVGFTIHHINSKDGQQYKCEFKAAPNEDPQSFTYILNVFDTPTIEIVNTPKYALEGDDFNFVCRILPLNDMITNDYSVRWRGPNDKMYPQNFLSPDRRISANTDILDTVEGTSSLKIQNIKSSLKIHNINHNDTGTYKCQFQSWSLQLEATTTINVTVIDPLTVNIMNAPKHVIEGDDFNFECKIRPLIKAKTNFTVYWRAPNGEKYLKNSTSPDGRISTSTETSMEKSNFSDGFVEYLILTSSLKIKNINHNDTGTYKCGFESSDLQREATTTVNVAVIDPLTVNIMNASKYAIEGDDFTFECMIRPLIKGKTDFTVYWRAPNGEKYLQNSPSSDERISTSTETSLEKLNFSDGSVEYLILTSFLKLNNINHNDTGTYKCGFESSDLQLEATRTVNVTDIQLVNVSLNLPSDDESYTYAVLGHDKEISATIVTRSNNLEGIQVIWRYSGFNNSIVTNHKYEVTTTGSITKLVIKNAVERDGGEYSVWVTNGPKIESASAILRVSNRTLKFTTKFNTSYKPFTEIQIKSWIGRPPQKNITWLFQKYIDSGTKSYGELVLLKDFSINNNSMKFMTSTVSLNLTQTGIIICKACFRHFCDSQNQIIVVADDKLETTKFGDVVLEGSNVNTTCSASSDYYISNITWQKKNGQIINETDRIKIINSTRNSYTYKSTIEIKSVETSDDTTYKCVAIAKNGTTVWKEEKLSIKVKIMPISITSNMNGTEIVIDEGEARRITVPLTCYVEGLPRPTISWLKNRKPIVESNSTVYKFFNKTQELHIVHPKNEHSGQYVCKAYNNYDEKEVSQPIVIAGNRELMGIILGIMIPFVACVVLGIYYMIAQRSVTKEKIDLASQFLANFVKGDLENVYCKATADGQALSLPYDSKWEFTRENLILQQRLGSGHFGVVMKAKAHGICKRDVITTVAVKMVKKPKSLSYLKVLASELKLLSYIGRHLNIVNLLGACTTKLSKGELLVILEYCELGNLHAFLQEHRHNFVNQIGPASGKRNGPSPNEGASDEIAENDNGESLNGVSRRRDRDHPLPITTENLLIWSFQSARGMDYLAQKKVFHGDFAARNVLLTVNNVIKICDFGLARNLYHYEVYQKKSNDPLPLKWMAIESIRDRIFSTKSDVWSFGVFLWEVFTLASTPYPEFTAQEVYKKLVEGYRMGQSEYMSDAIYKVMLRCWDHRPAMRPTFSTLTKIIGEMLPKSVETHFIELNSPYVRSNETESSGVGNRLASVSRRSDLQVLMSRSTDKNGHVTVDLADVEDVSLAGSDQVPNDAAVSSDTPHAESDNLPGCSRSVSAPASPSMLSRTVTFLRSMLIGRIIGFKNPNYVSTDEIPTS